MYIINIGNDDICEVKRFLNSISSIKNIDEDILQNGIALLDDDNQICGFVTYEKFCEYGLIRYFIFQKTIDFNYIDQMFLKLIVKAGNNNIVSLISIGNNDDVIDLFEKLGFQIIEFDSFIINDQTLHGTEFEQSKILNYIIK